MYRTCTVRSPFRRLYLSCEAADLDRERVPPASLPVTGVRQSAGGDLSSPHSYSIPIVFAVPFQLNECGRLSASTLGFICKCSGALFRGSSSEVVDSKNKYSKSTQLVVEHTTRKCQDADFVEWGKGGAGNGGSDGIQMFHNTGVKKNNNKRRRS